MPTARLGRIGLDQAGFGHWRPAGAQTSESIRSAECLATGRAYTPLHEKAELRQACEILRGAMSQENVEIAVGYFEAANLASAIDALAEDVRLVFHGQLRQLAGADTISGKKAAVDWLADWFSRFEPDYRFEVEESCDLGDRVLVVIIHRAKGRASGVPTSQTTANVIAVRDNKIVRHDFFDSREEALEAAGLSE